MNGAEHYRQAELLLESCQIGRLDNEGELYPAVAVGDEDVEDGVDSCRNALMAAQVHATLALADATEKAAS